MSSKRKPKAKYFCPECGEALEPIKTVWGVKRNKFQCMTGDCDVVTIYIGRKGKMRVIWSVGFNREKRESS